ncbi:hypothetical protein LYSIN_01857 [Lysinibacillus sphaericus]|uniref:Uncharacterized protein n=1 Tax=Lysinibacillus sphaericus TaxID=1421 RepID=A0A2S5D1Y7_LYSSH|nr:hypothetical protein LYSIN_01857 [Lysinibacillus sphaericus]
MCGEYAKQQADVLRIIDRYDTDKKVAIPKLGKYLANLITSYRMSNVRDLEFIMMTNQNRRKQSPDA